MSCAGNLDEHCCWIDGRPCPFLRDDRDAERRWVCTLRERYGSWDAVHASDEYRPVGAHFARLGVSLCGDWPGAGEHCATCGASGA